MKILHLAVQAPYNEGWGYQENILTKYQAKLGHEVTLVTTVMKNNHSNAVEICEPDDYMSKDGFRVIRLDYEQFRPRYLSERFKKYNIYPLLLKIRPDFIMVHGLGNITALQVKKYVKNINPKCTVIADNHLDYNIGGGFTSRKFSTSVLRFIYRCMNASVQKIYAKVYGVTPWRSQYANEVFGISKDKLDVLPAGADDEKIDYENKNSIRSRIREKHNLSDDDFLIVTGGKIDERKNIDRLMEAIQSVSDKRVKLLVFGQCSDSIRERVEKLAEHSSVRYIGWISSDDTYDYFLASDLMFFPGQHSVMWEQACACGVPCVFKHYHAMHHCDIGGNCFFLEDDSVSGIADMINYIINEPKVYQNALRVAQSEGRKQFLYSELAKKSIETARRN